MGLGELVFFFFSLIFLLRFKYQYSITEDKVRGLWKTNTPPRWAWSSRRLNAIHKEKVKSLFIAKKDYHPK